MSTILTVSAAASWTAPQATDVNYLKVTRRCYSIDGYSPVRVTIRITDVYAHVKTDAMPDGMTAWWREPTAAQRRMLVDHELFKVGMVRNGRVMNETADGWYHQYPIRALNTPHRDCSDTKPHAEHMFRNLNTRMDDPSFGAWVDCAGR